MQNRLRRALPVALAAVLAAGTGAARAADQDMLKLIVGELPLPPITFQLGISMAVGQTALVGLGDPIAALKAADGRIAQNPNDADPHLRRGMALEVLDRPGREEEYARAAYLYQQAMDARADDVDARIGWARAKAQLNAWDEVRPAIRALATEHPELWWPHMALAIDTMASWDAKSAPAEPEALSNALAQVMDNALAEVGEALRASPDEPAPRWLAAMLHWLREVPRSSGPGGAASPGVLARVDPELREAAKACPGEPMLQVFARWATATRAMMEAGGEGDMPGMWQRMRAQDQRMLTEDELATAAMVRTEAGRIPPAYELLAVYAVLHGDDGGAKAWLKQSVDYDPASAERWLAYVANLARLGEVGEMGSAVQEALAKVNNGKLRCTAAKLCALRADWAEAEKAAQAAVAVGDESLPLAQLLLGVVRLKAGNAAGAVEPLSAAAPRWSENGLAEASLALALALTGKQAEAAEHIAQARRLTPDERLYERAAQAIGG